MSDGRPPNRPEGEDTVLIVLRELEGADKPATLGPGLMRSKRPLGLGCDGGAEFWPGDMDGAL